MKIVAAALLVATTLTLAPPAQARGRWSEAQANAWYARQSWLVGANYAPASAINQLEMWQAATWDPQRIDAELTLAQGIGMNTMRVFLHDQLWAQDPQGFKARIDTFLTIAQRHGIRPLFVLFDSCWDPDPKLGPQHPPIPGVHNSGWVQGPGMAGLRDLSRWPAYKAYVQGVVGAFRDDPRVLGWDLWNEPDNPADQYRGQEGKEPLVRALLAQVFDWARDADPSQPVTSGVWWHDDWAPTAKVTPMERLQIGQSDVVTFHDYSWPETFARRVRQLAAYGRPVICTEYMARGNGSTFDTVLPIGKRANVGMINWGFVDGKTQTRLPWDSWKKPYTMDEPTIWFHEVFRADGTPYRRAETDMIRRLSAAPKGVAPPRPHRHRRRPMTDLDRRLFVAGAAALCATPAFAAPLPADGFPNPLVRQRADAQVFRHTDGWYYMTASVPEYDRIVLRRARTIAGLSSAQEKILWRHLPSGPMSGFLWAPELHLIDGHWIMYFAAGPSGGGEDVFRIRTYALQCDGADPITGRWSVLGALQTPWDSFTLDSTSFVHRGTRYLAWAQAEPGIATNSNLYLAPLTTPLTLAAPPARLAVPTLPWEVRGYKVAEAPALLARNGRLFMTYSASATDARYCLGMLTANADADIMDPAVWRKSPEPVLATSPAHHIYGPGHNSFTVDERGRDVLIYHARDYAAIKGDPLFDPNRHTRARHFGFHADGTPDFGWPSDRGTA